MPARTPCLESQDLSGHSFVTRNSAPNSSKSGSRSTRWHSSRQTIGIKALTQPDRNLPIVGNPAAQRPPARETIFHLPNEPAAPSISRRTLNGRIALNLQIFPNSQHTLLPTTGKIGGSTQELPIIRDMTRLHSFLRSRCGPANGLRRSRLWFAPLLVCASLCPSCAGTIRSGTGIQTIRTQQEALASAPVEEPSASPVHSPPRDASEPGVQSTTDQTQAAFARQIPNDVLPPPSPTASEATPREEPMVEPTPSFGTDEPAAAPDAPLPVRDDVAVKLEPASLEASDNPLPINLAAALRLADARPLVVAAAQASAWVAEAQLQRAQLLWVPELDIGALYYRHDGFGPDFNLGVNNPRYGGPTPGGPLNTNLHWFYGYGSIYRVVNMSDAIFQPLAARQTLDAQRHDIQTAKNDALLATARAYFDVHQQRGQYAAALHVVDLAEQLVFRIDALARDLVPAIEVARARRLHASLQQQAASARERWRVSSANLTQILRLDPSAVVVPLESDHLQITLIDLARPLDELIAIGESHRPEIYASAARVRAAEQDVRREWYRPLLPLVLLTGFQTPGGMMTQFGIFGTGPDTHLDLWSPRNDFSFQLVWQLEGFGFGNLARIKEQRGHESKSIVTLFRQQDTVAAEVTAAQARAQAAAVRALQAERELREAIISYDGNYEGLAETTRFGDVLHVAIRPQEAVQALNQLMMSYDEYFLTVAEYNKAQFELYHAVGYPARSVSDDPATGDSTSIDLDRPFGLPPVFDGPPPANR